MSERIISNPRVIRGLFTQLQQCGNPITVLDVGIVKHCSIGPAIPGVTEYSLAIPLSPDAGAEISVSFWINNDYFSCKLDRETEGIYLPPFEVVSVNRRARARIDATDISSPLVGVLCTQTTKSFTRVQNMDREFISVRVADSASFVKGSSGLLSVYSGGILTGIHSIVISSVSLSPDAINTVLLKTTQSHADVQRTNSRGGPTMSIVLNLTWPNEDGFAVPIELLELTGMGMSGRFITPAGELFPIGTIFRERASGARIRFAWSSGAKAGFSFDTAEPKLREQLYNYLHSSIESEKHGPALARSKHTLSMLTQSGLLRSERALSYANIEKRELFNYRSGASNRWLCQIPSRFSFLSFVRISDDGWLIQELGTVGRQAVPGSDLILGGIEYFHISRHEELSPQTGIVGIYDVTSKFNLRFWREALLKHVVSPPVYCRVTLGRIRGRVLRSSPEDEIELLRVTSGNWKKVFESFRPVVPADVLSAFGIHSHDFDARLLGELILSDAKKLEREVYAARARNGAILGVVLKLGLPPLANATSLVENLYVIPSESNSALLLKNLFTFQNALLVGVEDICILGSTEEDDTLLAKIISNFTPREFELAWIQAQGLRRAA